MARAGHQVHRKEPLGQIGPRLVKDRASGRINVMAALLAGVGAALAHGVELSALDATSGTRDFGAAVVDFHELGQARRIGRIFGLELLERVSRHDRPLVEGKSRLRLTCRQGIIPGVGCWPLMSEKGPLASSKGATFAATSLLWAGHFKSQHLHFRFSRCFGAPR